MTSPLNIHPDFRKVPAIKLSFNPFILAAMKMIASMLAAPKWAKYKRIATRKKITGLDGHRVPLWVIKPEGLNAASPVLLYFHGGAFALKYGPRHIDNAVRYAREANCCVIFVEYRLAPNNPFPAPFNDCYSALLWACQNAEQFGFDPKRIAVGGDSAGGTLAASVAQKAAHEDAIALCGQLLVYPATDSDCKSKSSTAFANVRPFKQASSPAVWKAYLGHPHTTAAPRYASPLHGNLTGLAPAYVETAEFDVLHDEGLAYAKAMQMGGVNVTLNETKSTVHGFDLLASASALSQQAIASRVQFLRNVFQS